MRTPLEVPDSPLRATARPALVALLAALAALGCTGTRKLADPTLRIFTEGGTELGVSTAYGVVFLGRTSRAGYIEVEAIFGDGPNIETTVIEPVGGGLYTAETEIRLPTVPMTFQEPQVDEQLLVAGRNERGPWETRVRVRKDPRVRGILLDVPRQLDGRQDQIGAGVYRVNPRDENDRRLLGLVSGRVRISGSNRSSEYLTVMGPDALWRLVTHRRDLLEHKPPVYRDDIR